MSKKRGYPKHCPTCGNKNIMKCRFTGDNVVDGYVMWMCGHQRKVRK